MYKRFPIICVLLIMASTLSAQNLDPKPLIPINFGLSAPQDQATLPKSNVPVVWPERKAKLPAKTTLKQDGNNSWEILDGWEMTDASNVIASKEWMFDRDYDTGSWLNATVPGTVLTTLVDEGIFPDPYYGLNNLAIPDSLCRMEWWYRTEFDLPSEAVGRKIWLCFNGINYRADVWLNGRLLGSIRGAFARGIFMADGIMPEGNVLAVHIYPPYNPGIPQEQSRLSGSGPNGGQLCFDGPTFISSEGWDWVPGIRDRNIGIWQSVSLKCTGGVSIADPQVITDLPLPDTSSAAIIVKATLVGSEHETVTVKGEIGSIEFSKTVSVGRGERKAVEFSADEFPQLNIRNPRLWWPNGYGPQNLYTLKLTVSSQDGILSDSQTVRFGIRELSYEMTVDSKDRKDRRVEFNPTFALRSGKPIFDNLHRRQTTDGVVIASLREDADPGLLTDLDDKAMDPYLVIRVNGRRIFCKGGNWGMDDGMKRVRRERLEPYFRLHKDAHFNMVRNWTGENCEELFYELCDEYGMLVWNDFWLSTEGYNQNVNDEDLFMENATEVVKRFRNHPSLAIWCPRNEGYAPPSLEVCLNEMLAKEDGTRYYQPNSRYLNLRPSGPWQYFKDPADYYRNNAHGFNTEQGSPSVPTAESIRKMMPVEDQWPISDTWYYHDLHSGLPEYIDAIRSIYGESSSLDDFCRKAQMVNYDSYRAMFESWNSHIWNNTSGLLLWMTHPAWPSMEWQTYSWDYETTGSYFGSMKACEPVHIQLNLHDDKVVVVNLGRTALSGGKAALQCYSLDGKLISRQEQKISSVETNSVKEIFTAVLPSAGSIYLARVVLTDRKGRVLSVNDYWKSPDNSRLTLNSLPSVSLKGRIRKSSEDGIILEVSNPSDVIAVAIKLNARDSEGSPILPAYFSDGYFNLLPGEKRTISLSCMHPEPFVITSEGYNVERIILSSVESFR